MGKLLAAAGAGTVASHWSDEVFVRLRRALGLHLELMVLMIAEVVALGYYRVLRDGAGDPLTAVVAGRILADERRHVPFHMDRLAGVLSGVGLAAWRVLFLAVVLVVAVDHGAALRALGVTRVGFVREVVAEFTAATRRRGVTVREAASSSA
ncbi:hypothetical protein [Actinokineospora inagensis]|uniref:hypothetical protein n=1 Tax=Actinokineospora inagensis TaxID=103730 RepID=UPI001FDF339F|nr:hypothetical protein [Actinokineospora inagensis]